MLSWSLNLLCSIKQRTSTHKHELSKPKHEPRTNGNKTEQRATAAGGAPPIIEHSSTIIDHWSAKKKLKVEFLNCWPSAACLTQPRSSSSVRGAAGMHMSTDVASYFWHVTESSSDHKSLRNQSKYFSSQWQLHSRKWHKWEQVVFGMRLRAHSNRTLLSGTMNRWVLLSELYKNNTLIVESHCLKCMKKHNVCIDSFTFKLWAFQYWPVIVIIDSFTLNWWAFLNWSVIVLYLKLCNAQAHTSTNLQSKDMKAVQTEQARTKPGPAAGQQVFIDSSTFKIDNESTKLFCMSIGKKQ